MGIQSGADGHHTLVRIEQSKTEEECSVGVSQVVISAWSGREFRSWLCFAGCVILRK